MAEIVKMPGYDEIAKRYDDDYAQTYNAYYWRNHEKPKFAGREEAYGDYQKYGYIGRKRDFNLFNSSTKMEMAERARLYADFAERVWGIERATQLRDAAQYLEDDAKQNPRWENEQKGYEFLKKVIDLIHLYDFGKWIIGKDGSKQVPVEAWNAAGTAMASAPKVEKDQNLSYLSESGTAVNDGAPVFRKTGKFPAIPEGVVGLSGNGEVYGQRQEDDGTRYSNIPFQSNTPEGFEQAHQLSYDLAKSAIRELQGKGLSYRETLQAAQGARPAIKSGQQGAWMENLLAATAKDGLTDEDRQRIINRVLPFQG